MSEIEVNAAGQVASFWIAAAVGVALCLLYDLLRIIRSLKRPGYTAAFVQDVLWSAVAAMITYIVMLVECSGAVRFYIFAGEALGFLACRLTLSRAVMFLSQPAIKALKSVYKFLKTKIISPLAAFVSKIAAFIFGHAKKIPIFLKKHLKRIMQLVYNRHKYKSDASAKRGTKGEKSKTD